MTMTEIYTCYLVGLLVITQSHMTSCKEPQLDAAGIHNIGHSPQK